MAGRADTVPGHPTRLFGFAFCLAALDEWGVPDFHSVEEFYLKLLVCGFRLSGAEAAAIS